MPDATELELTAQELRDAHSDSIIDTEFHRGRAVLVADPSKIKGWGSLFSDLDVLGSRQSIDTTSAKRQ